MVQCYQQRSFRNGQKGDHSFSMWWITRLLEAIASYNCNCRTFLGVMYIQHVPFFKDEYSQYNTFFWSFYDFVIFLACKRSFQHNIVFIIFLYVLAALCNRHVILCRANLHLIWICIKGKICSIYVLHN